MMFKKIKRLINDQKGYYITDSFQDIIMLAVGILMLVIAMTLFTAFANMLSNTVSGTTTGTIMMAVVWTLPLLFVAVLIMPIVQKFSGGRPPSM